MSEISERGKSPGLSALLQERVRDGHTDERS